MSDLSVRLSRFRPESPRWREAIAESPALIGVAGATFLAALPFLRDYRVGGAVALLVVASVVPVVIALACSVIWRLAAGFGYTLSAVGLVLVLLVYMGPHPGVVTAELGRAPNRLLTQTLPLGGARATMVAVVVLTWLCAAIASEMLIRGRRRGYGLSMIALTVPVGLFVLSYAVSASAPGSDRAVGPLLLVVLAAIAVARHRETEAAIVSVEGGTGDEPEKSPPKYRGVVAGAVIAIGVTAVAALVIAAVPSSGRKPASLHRAAPTATTVLVDPVDSMAQLRDGNPHGPASRELAVDLSRASTGYLGMAILDDYDGAVWQFTATFGPTGGRIPDAGAAGPAPLDNSTVTQHVILEGQLPIALLPALDRPAAVAGVSIAADPATGMFLPVSAKNGLLTYTAVSTRPRSHHRRSATSRRGGLGLVTWSVDFAGRPRAPGRNVLCSGYHAALSLQSHGRAPGAERGVFAVGRGRAARQREAGGPLARFRLDSLGEAQTRADTRAGRLLQSESDRPQPGPGRPGDPSGTCEDHHDHRACLRQGHRRYVAVGGDQRSHRQPQCHSRTVCDSGRHGGPLPGSAGPGCHRISCAPDLRRPCHRAGQLPGDRPSGLDVGGDSRGRPGLGRCRPHA